MKTILLGILFTLFILGNLRSQDIQFSQYQRIPTSLNPGLTGLLPGAYDRQVNIIYRDQWNSFLGQSSFKTYGFSFEMRNCLTASKSKTNNGKHNKFSVPTWGLGLSVIRDESGTLSVKGISDQYFPLLRDHLSLSGSIILPVNDNTFLSGGFSFGGILSRLKTQHLRYDDQFDGIAGFDGSITGELDAMRELNNSALNIGTGISLTHVRRIWGANIGLAVDHIFKPVEYRFIESETVPELSRRITLHGKYTVRFLKKKQNTFGLQFNSMLMHQSPYQQLITGAGFFYQNGNGLTATIGAGFRNVRYLEDKRDTDAVIFKVGLDLTQFAFGFSYDINASKLNEASHHYGALEFSFSYRFKNERSTCAPALEGGCDPDGKNIHPVFF